MEVASRCERAVLLCLGDAQAAQRGLRHGRIHPATRCRFGRIKILWRPPRGAVSFGDEVEPVFAERGWLAGLIRGAAVLSDRRVLRQGCWRAALYVR
jgi:hypothetical protein